jgi:hypothetical protein
MILHRYGENAFVIGKYSNLNILTYAAAHLGRMIAHDGVRLAARITATSAVLNTVEGGTTEELAKVAMQKSRTVVKAAFRTALPGHITKIHGAVVAAFGADGPEVMLCFPLGRTIFTTCTDEALNNRLGQLVTSITPLSATVGAAHVTAATGLATSWGTLYGAQGQAKDATSVSTEARTAAMNALKLELFKNLLTIALNDPEDPDRIDLLCPQHLLEGRASATTPGVATLTLVNYNSANRQADFTMTAENADSFRVYRRMVGEADMSLWAENLKPVDGVASYSIGLNTEGPFEFVAEGVNGSRTGERSNIVSVPPS